MRDVHCHILPGVDDGARDLAESLAMAEAAQAAGVTSIVCTPHVRDPYFDFDAMWAAFDQLDAELKKRPESPSLAMGFEVNYKKLMELGMPWADYLGNQQGEFLLELPTRALPQDWERIVFELQGKGYTVIIAHPERYKYVWDDISIVDEFRSAGCKIQLSADCHGEGRFSPTLKTAKALLESNRVHFIASDAHDVNGYELLADLRRKYKPAGAHARS